jgi:hypothetical protein
MKKPVRRFLFWTPRILCLLFAAFISIFAADVFGEGHGFWNTTLLLLLHLIPTGILLAILAVSWRWEWVGGILLFGLGIYYIVTNLNHIDWCVVIGGPPILTGALFLINWHYRKELRTST